MSELTSMKNIGDAIATKLKSVEIDTPEKLCALGSREAFFRLKARHPNVCLVHLYALEGAVSDMDYNRLPEKTKKDLQVFCHSIA